MFADPEDGGGKSLCVGDLRRGSEWPKMCLLQTHKREERKKSPPSSHTHTHTHTHKHTKMALTNNKKQTTAVLVVTLPSGRSLHPSPLLCCSGHSNCNSAHDNSRGGDEGGMVFWFFDDHLDDHLPLWENKRITVLGCPSLLPTVCTEEQEALKIGRIPHTWLLTAGLQVYGCCCTYKQETRNKNKKSKRSSSMHEEKFCWIFFSLQQVFSCMVELQCNNITSLSRLQFQQEKLP